jgi:HEAT repeat protein
MLKGLVGKILRGLTANRSAFREADAFLKMSPIPEAAVRDRLPQYIASSSWEVRNVAAKLIAKLKEPSFYPVLIEKVRSGADVGIITRNSIAAIRRLGLRTPEVENALRGALSHRYWEVRCEAARALSELFEPSPERTALMVNVLHLKADGKAVVFVAEKNFEIRAAVAVALGRAGEPDASLLALELLADDPHWLVRHQAAVALAEISCRDGAVAGRAAAVLENIDALSDGCRSDFPLPKAMASLRKIILNGAADTQPARIRKHYINMQRGWNRNKAAT